MARGRIKVEDGERRIRVYLDGELIADTITPRLVWEKPYYPVYYFPQADVRTELLSETDQTRRSPSRGTATVYQVKGSGTSVGSAYAYAESPIEELVGYIAFDWHTMTQWFEEDEEVFVHARNPYTRVDILPSSRHIKVSLDGATIAETTKPTLVFETGVRTRYYLPKSDFRLDLLEHTETVTHCPYKGAAEYWSVNIGETTHSDILWSYRHPVAEAAKLAGLIGLYNERLDIEVDGVLLAR